MATVYYTARTCQEGNFLVEYVQIKVKTIIKRLNDVKRQTNYLVCNIEGTGTCFSLGDVTRNRISYFILIGSPIFLFQCFGE